MPSGFDGNEIIYRIEKPTDLMVALICAEPGGPAGPGEEEIAFFAPAGKNRLDELHKWLAKLVSKEPTFWFSIVDRQKSAEYVERARSGEHSDFLKRFASDSAAGAHSYLGLLAESGDWLLLHSLLPGEEFQISIHGQTRLCRDLCRLLRVSGPQA